MVRPLDQAVVVITGASSGIARATARAFALRGASVVLAARREGVLQEVARECESLGGRALAVATDVTDADAVERLAERAVEAFGRIDVWVNAASVTLFARFEEAPRADYERVIQTNVLGYVNGARAAIRRFREQGEGCLINVGSMVGHIGQPYTSAYVSSKWAVRGLSECLRMEVADLPEVHVSTVNPAAIDTPFFRHAANYTGRLPKPLRPVYSPEEVAAAVLRQAQDPRPEVIVGGAGKALALTKWLAPGLAKRLMAKQVEIDHFKNDEASPATAGNLHDPFPDEDAAVRGGWTLREHGVSFRGSRLVLAALAVGAITLPLCLYRQGRKRAGGRYEG